MSSNVVSTYHFAIKELEAALAEARQRVTIAEQRAAVAERRAQLLEDQVRTAWRCNVHATTRLLPPTPHKG